MNDRELMAVRADVDYTHDARGRMLMSNEPLVSARRPAPRLVLGCTRAGYVVRYGAGLPDRLVCRLQGVVDRLPAPDALQASPAALAALREALAEDAPIAAEGGGPAYRFPEVIPWPGEVVRVEEANREVARDTYPWLYREFADWQPCFAVVRDGVAVSVCFSARLSAAAAEAGIETLPEYRGRGFATAVTAAWGAAIRATGRIPLYSTARGNHASQAVARHLGLVQFGVDVAWR